MAGLTYLKNVVTLELDASTCVACGMCSTVCPQAVPATLGGRTTIVDRDACMECGACARNCATGAITVQAGVGCASAVINTALGRSGDSCCCTVEQGDAKPRQ